MIENPILKVLSSIRTRKVQCLLMGGQACILYGGAEFSRDTDLAILADTANLQRLREALDDLNASCIAVPPFAEEHLEAGLSIHFRCQHPEAFQMRLDVISKMRGVASFDQLYARRTTLDLEGERLELMSLPDLVQSKKTQRDKDWPMITRLVEANYFSHRESPAPEQVDFWLQEMRTPDLLVEIAQRFEGECAGLHDKRPLLLLAGKGELESLGEALKEEENAEREADRLYWRPLKEKLEQLRRDRRRNQN